MNQKLAKLINGFPLQNLVGTLDREIGSIAYDSRKVEPSALFVAMPGLHHDGSRFIDDALQKGAGAYITESSVEDLMEQGIGGQNATGIHVTDARHALAWVAARFYGDPSHHMELTAITGTNGKTTLTYLLESIYKANDEPSGVIGSINYRYADTLRPAPMTTPEALEINRMLAEMWAAGIQRGVMEVSSHSLALKRVRELKFAIGVFTNFSRDHLDYHKTLDHYKKSKKSLFLDCTVGKQVINIDDDVGRELAAELPQVTLTTGIDQSADVTAENLKIGPDGVQFRLKTPYGATEIKSMLLGRHNVYNILSAAAVGVIQGITLDTIARGVRELARVPGRFEKVDEDQNFIVAVDYAHTDDALVNALKAARTVTTNRVLVVFGCGGDRDATKRPVMGKIAVELADFAVITSDNPRTEDPNHIIDQICAGIPDEIDPEGRYMVLPDRRAAIGFAINKAEPGDLVLIAGKGHEDYQIIGKEKIHFDDREEAVAALQQRFNVNG
ncbi:UDP-N-acetylmuramoyl-L-alanyl-D-glutamate--2,6-diaminopimelate ligase [Nitrospina watsonii]|uniref:UDP-N-acetylmuramoyl-L-alanyl-D-glutamate--2,6-diaminopimelate ligase n=1 Tax=Nitrospina watsonii TaxID=1323948 RepID=A0ABN8VV74_9BACT|nr:UDP-N-acetylmuramoyl-L-alanyl-D-glutamate--2,6-diaminopimelate ligase [Nitrospina watsonii]CAI2717700.1 UDP-N-acetylmuramoyl-L-alanyl-D-glutamate--2, 6-diaminopimelate ligase [Nitrospina watsonii]